MKQDANANEAIVEYPNYQVSEKLSLTMRHTCSLLQYTVVKLLALVETIMLHALGRRPFERRRADCFVAVPK